MAADDIFHVQWHFESPSGNATVGMYYEETIQHTGGDQEIVIFGDAVFAHLNAEIKAIISQDFRLAGCKSTKRDGNAAPHALNPLTLKVGGRVGDAAPANNAVVFGLRQTVFSPKSDGRIFFPGIAEFDMLQGNLTAAYLTGPIQALESKMSQPVPELSAGAGQWKLGIISTKVLNATPPFKDWAGAYAQVTQVAASTIVGTMRKRQTKVYGTSTV